MASGGKEHRMLFDLRGRRRNVVKVVYAVLAVLMGLSLFLVTGSNTLSNLFGGGGGGNTAGKVAEEQAERIERKLVKDPEDPELLLGLTRARLSAANGTLTVNPETGEAAATVETRQQYEKASQAWSEYLEATNEPSPGGAQLVAPALFQLAQISRTPNEIVANMNAAADAQQIVVEQRPNLSTLSNYAIYRTFTFEYGAAQKAADEVAKLTTSKFERENFENQLEEQTKAAKEFQKGLAQAKKEERSGSGKESLENPLPGLGGGLSE
jgi:hypothetical protein